MMSGDFENKDFKKDDISEAFSDGNLSDASQKPAGSDPESGQPERRKKRDVNKRYKIFKWIGWGVAVLQVILSLILIIKIGNLGMLPENYMAAIVIVLVVLAGLTTAASFFKKTVIPGWVLGVLVIAAASVGCVYMSRTEAVLEEVTVDEDEEVYKVDSIVVAVLADDQAQTMDDAILYNFGIMATLDRENTDTVIANIEASAGIELSVTEYDDFDSLIADLKKGTVQAMIYNSAFDGTIEEIDEDFDDEVRILDNHSIETKVDLSTSDMNLTTEPFTVFISGIDVYGDISQTSRSDVNMLVTVNPVTKQVLMTTTPRDYYVQLPNVSGESRDKLTHAGIYGIDCSMDTLSSLYGIKIDYYVRVNFDTLKKIVNALGGVDVYSEYEFTTHYKNGGYEIKKGYNHMDGKTALAFSRERYNVPGGDEQRGRDQQAVLTAILKKAMSPSILTGYMGIMDSLSGSFETNISTNQIASIVKMQLADGAQWDIESQSVTGTTSMEICYSTGWQKLSVMYPDESSIYEARQAILEIGGVALEETDALYREFDLSQTTASYSADEDEDEEAFIYDINAGAGTLAHDTFWAGFWGTDGGTGTAASAADDDDNAGKGVQIETEAEREIN